MEAMAVLRSDQTRSCSRGTEVSIPLRNPRAAWDEPCNGVSSIRPSRASIQNLSPGRTARASRTSLGMTTWYLVDTRTSRMADFRVLSRASRQGCHEWAPFSSAGTQELSVDSFPLLRPVQGHEDRPRNRAARHAVLPRLLDRGCGRAPGLGAEARVRGGLASGFPRLRAFRRMGRSAPSLRRRCRVPRVHARRGDHTTQPTVQARAAVLR